MFSGIVQEIGKVVAIEGLGQEPTDTNMQCIRLKISLKQGHLCQIGDSVSINGVCLTVVEIDQELGVLSFDAVPETLRKTNLSLFKVGDYVNIELSVKLGDYIGGHMVQGHVDGVGQISHIAKEDAALIVRIQVKEAILKYFVNKGFVAIDGMSITVIEVTENDFSVTFIPHTIEATIVQTYKVGQMVNLEADPLGKQIHAYMEKYRALQ